MTSPHPGHLMLSKPVSVFGIAPSPHKSFTDCPEQCALEQKANARSRLMGDGGTECRTMIRRMGRLRDRVCSPVEIGLPGALCRGSQSLIIRNQQGHLSSAIF